MQPPRPPPHLAQLAWSTANSLREGRLDEALASCEAALAVSRGDEPAQASVRTTKGGVLRALGRLGEARAVLVRALAVHEASGERRLAGLTQQELGAVDVELGEVEEAMTRLVDAAGIHAALGDERFELRALVRLGAALHAVGRIEEARSHLESALARAEALDEAGAVGMALGFLALLDHEAGRLSAALGRLHEALARPAPLADVALLHVAVGRIRLERGAVDDAREHARTAREIAERTSQPHVVGLAAVVTALSYVPGGQLELAEAALAEAEPLLADHPSLSGLVGVSRGHLDLARGDRDAAFARLGAVSAAGLRSVPVRLGMRLLRTALTQR